MLRNYFLKLSLKTPNYARKFLAVTDSRLATRANAAANSSTTVDASYFGASSTQSKHDSTIAEGKIHVVSADSTSNTYSSAFTAKAISEQTTLNSESDTLNSILTAKAALNTAQLGDKSNNTVVGTAAQAPVNNGVFKDVSILRITALRAGTQILTQMHAGYSQEQGYMLDSFAKPLYSKTDRHSSSNKSFMALRTMLPLRFGSSNHISNSTITGSCKTPVVLGKKAAFKTAQDAKVHVNCDISKLFGNYQKNTAVVSQFALSNPLKFNYYDKVNTNQVSLSEIKPIAKLYTKNKSKSDAAVLPFVTDMLSISGLNRSYSSSEDSSVLSASTDPLNVAINSNSANNSQFNANTVPELSCAIGSITKSCVFPEISCDRGILAANNSLVSRLVCHINMTIAATTKANLCSSTDGTGYLDFQDKSDSWEYPTMVNNTMHISQAYMQKLIFGVLYIN